MVLTGSILTVLSKLWEILINDDCLSWYNLRLRISCMKLFIWIKSFCSFGHLVFMLCHGFTSCPDYSKRKSTDFSFNVIVAWLLGQNLSLIRQSDEVNHFLQGALSTSRWRFNIEEFELFGVEDFSVISPQCSQTRAGVSPGVWGGVYYFVRLHVGSVLGILIQYLVRCCALLCALRTRRWWCREKKK